MEDPNLRDAGIFKRQAVEAVDLCATALGNAAHDLPQVRERLLELKAKVREIEAALACVQIPTRDELEEGRGRDT